MRNMSSTFSNYVNSKFVLVVAALMLGLTVLNSGSANAATYTVEREDLRLTIHTSKHRVLSFQGWTRVRCTSGKTRRVHYNPWQINARIRPSGRFYWAADFSRFNDTNATKLRGTVYRGRIRGAILQRQQQPGNPQQWCWSGRSNADAWDGFAARRVR